MQSSTASTNQATNPPENVSSTEKPFTCLNCSYASLWENNLARHEATHTKNEKIFKCQECTKFYNRKELLYLHFKEVPGHRLKYCETRPYKCQKCSYASYSKSSLTRHEKTHGEPETLHHCKVCTNYYNNTRSLINHHTQEPEHNPIFYDSYDDSDPEERCTFTCHLCSYATDCPNKLTRHIETHTEGEELFRCRKCTKYYHRKELLFQHFRREKEHRPAFPETLPFICSSCSYATDKQCHLTRHEDTHVEGEQLFDCGVCVNHYNSTKSLSNHYVRAPDHHPSTYEGYE